MPDPLRLPATRNLPGGTLPSIAALQNLQTAHEQQPRRLHDNPSCRNQEHEAHFPRRFEGTQQHRRGRGPAPDRQRTAHPLHGPRVCAQGLHQRRRHRPGQPQSGDPDRPGPRPPALQLPVHLRRHDAGGLPVPRARPAGHRHGRLRHQRSRVAPAHRLLGRPGARLPGLPLPVVGGRRLRPPRHRNARLPSHGSEGRPVLRDHGRQ